MINLDWGILNGILGNFQTESTRTKCIYYHHMNEHYNCQNYTNYPGKLLLLSPNIFWNLIPNN